MRYETEAASNTASTSVENTHIINHMFRVYKCVCTNIKVDMAMKLWDENLDSNEQAPNEQSSNKHLKPQHTCTQHIYNNDLLDRVPDIVTVLPYWLQCT